LEAEVRALITLLLYGGPKNTVVVEVRGPRETARERGGAPLGRRKRVRRVRGEGDPLGEKLRVLRSERGLTLAQLAKRAGVSVSFLSQLERGTNHASIETLRKIVQALEVPLFHIFISEHEDPLVVRREARKRMAFPGSEAEYELASPDLKRRMELVVISLQPGRATFRTAFSHPGEECDYVLSGKVRFEIGDRVEVLGEGDAIYFDCAIPHRFLNVGSGPAVLLAAVTPPTF
jgi:transcriptional regulator with XRE-family HTH domain